LPKSTPVWRPYAGIRFIRLADNIDDRIQQTASGPLPGAPPDVPSGGPSDTTDQDHWLDIHNNLIGCQLGIRRDLWRLGRRFSLEGFVNFGCYCNLAKQTESTTTTTTETVIIDPIPPAVEPVVETNISSATSRYSVNRTEFATAAEGSLTAVFRLNRCWSMRGGYQLFWLNGVFLADDAFLKTTTRSESLVSQGWHVGLEHRR
jgi:hypothetical protein